MRGVGRRSDSPRDRDGTVGRARSIARALAPDAAAILIAAPLLAAICAPGWFVGHDDLHVVRLFEQDLVLRAGQIPARWYPDVASGYGSPHPQFYAPLFYLLAEIFRLAGLSLTAALKGAIVVVVAGTSIAMRRLGGALFGPGAGLVAAAAYTYAPYHLADLFVRTAFSELTVFLFVPLVALCFVNVSASPTPGRVAAAGAAVAGLCLSHTVSLLIVPLVLIFAAATAAPVAPRPRGAALPASLAASIGLGALLAGFFLVPLAAETGLIETGIFSAGYLDYRQHFATAGQLLWSPWGFGLSVEGTPDGMSFRIGLIQLGGGALALLLLPAMRRMRPAAAAATAACLAVAAVGAFLSTPAAAWVWAALPPMRFFQFPWRFLLLPAVGLSLAAGAAASVLLSGRARPAWLTALVCGLIAASSVPMIGFEKRLPLESIRFARRDVPAAAGAPRAGPFVFDRGFVHEQMRDWPDHLPRGVTMRMTPEERARPRVEIVEGAGRILEVRDGVVRWTMRVQAEGSVRLRLNVHRYAGWRWSIDGHPAVPAPSSPGRPVLTVDVPAGEHEVEASYGRTPARWAGDLATIAGLAVCAVLIVRPGSWRRR